MRNGVLEYSSWQPLFKVSGWCIWNNRYFGIRFGNWWSNKIYIAELGNNFWVEFGGRAVSQKGLKEG
jgi:hypothetical protein